MSNFIDKTDKKQKEIQRYGQKMSSAEGETKSAFIDDKFDVIISELENLGWKRCPFQSSRCDLIWTNLARVDWKKVGSSQIVNHVRGSQHLSNKSFLAFHMAVHGKQNRMPFQWSAAYQDLGELISMVALCTIYGACVATLAGENLGREQDESEIRKAIIETENLLAVLDMDEDAKRFAANEFARSLLHALKEGTDLEAALSHAQTYGMNGMLSRTLIGSKGIWIVKEVGSSCGRGISICAGAKELMRLVESMNFKCVVQKYIERPLLVRDGRKFDIRQWVLIRSLQPLLIYGFSEFYCRMSKRKYNLSPTHFGDPAMHLCNHAVQSVSSADGKEDRLSSSKREGHESGFMMSQWELEEHLQSLHSSVSLRSDVLPQIRQAAVDAVHSVTSCLSSVGRDSFEWLGLDLMITEDLSVRLIEVNVSPDVSRSTEITSRLVETAVKGLLPIVLENAVPGEQEEQGPKWEQWYPNREFFSAEEDEKEEIKQPANPHFLRTDYSPKKKHMFERALSSLRPASVDKVEMRGGKAVEEKVSDSEDEL